VHRHRRQRHGRRIAASHRGALRRRRRQDRNAVSYDAPESVKFVTGETATAPTKMPLAATSLALTHEASTSARFPPAESPVTAIRRIPPASIPRYVASASSTAAGKGCSLIRSIADPSSGSSGCITTAVRNPPCVIECSMASLHWYEGKARSSVNGVCERRFHRAAMANARQWRKSGRFGEAPAPIFSNCRRRRASSSKRAQWH
jgi:hypothetical protein